MDLLAGMAITGVVIGAVFHLSTTVTGRYHALQFSRLELNDLVIFSATLCQAIQVAEEIREVPGGFELISENTTAIFKKKEETLLMMTNEGSVSALKNIEQISLERLNEPAGASAQNESTPVEGIHVSCLVLNQHTELHFYKEYSPSGKINHYLVNEFEN